MTQEESGSIALHMRGTECMTVDEFVTEFLELIREIPDDASDANLVTGFLNEQLAGAEFKAPIEELLVVLKHEKPAIAGYLDLFGVKEFKRLLRSELSLEEALERLGKDKDYFLLPPQLNEDQRNM